LDQKEKLKLTLEHLSGVRLGVEQEDGIFRFPGEGCLEEALVFKPTLDKETIWSLFKDGVRVWMDWGSFIQSPDPNLCESVVCFMEKAWERYPTAKLEPIFSWIRAMYEAIPPFRLPWSFLVSPMQDGAFCVWTSPSCAPALAGLDMKEALSMLKGGAIKPGCLVCPIRTLCCGRFCTGGLESYALGAATALPDPMGCCVAFELFRASVILYDRLDQEGRLETYVEGGTPKKQTLKIEGEGGLYFHPVFPESLEEFLPLLSMAVNGGLFLFEKHLDPSLRELGVLLQQTHPKRCLLALLDAKVGLIGFLWLSMDESVKMAEAVLWLTDSAYALVDPMGLKNLLQRLLSFLELRKICLFAVRDHGKLTQLYEAAGLVLEGALREHLFKDGVWKDLKAYAVWNEA
jgi:hypothetical protein